MPPDFHPSAERSQAIPGTTLFLGSLLHFFVFLVASILAFFMIRLEPHLFLLTRRPNGRWGQRLCPPPHS